MDVRPRIAHYLRVFGGQVAVVEVDPIKQMEAALAGFKVGSLSELAPWGQAFITATARERVIAGDAFTKMPDGAVLANAGHFPHRDRRAGLAQRRPRGRI